MARKKGGGSAWSKGGWRGRGAKSAGSQWARILVFINATWEQVRSGELCSGPIKVTTPRAEWVGGGCAARIAVDTAQSGLDGEALSSGKVEKRADL